MDCEAEKGKERERKWKIMRRNEWRERWDREKFCISLFLHDEFACFFLFMVVRYLVCAEKPGITVG